MLAARQQGQGRFEGMSEIEIKGKLENDRVYASIGKVEGKTRRAIRHAWFDLGKALKASANRAILDKKSKSGNVYMIRSRTGSRRRRRHVASAPGQSHANMFGALRKSLGWKVHGYENMEFGYGASPRPVPRYAPFVEYGTSRMEHRPSLHNAIVEEGASAERDFVANMDREFKS